MGSRKIKEKDIKLLWGKAANICSFENCNTSLVDENKKDIKDVIIGEQAHIVAHKEDGPRGDSSFPKDKLEDYQNLILLCPTHHTSIDKNPEKYSVALLHEMKEKHEAWVTERVISKVPEVSFAELEILIKGILGKSKETSGGSDLVLTKPSDKMDKNNFNEQSRELVKLGLVKSGEVSDYLSKMSTMDADFGDRLKSVITEKYNQFKKEELNPNQILDELRVFCNLGSDNFLFQAAGLSVVVYFFQACEIFEK
jgi:hypothetical protein